MNFGASKSIAWVLFVLAFAGMVFASASNVPEKISLSNQPVTISFTLTNNASTQRSPSTQSLAPVGYYFTGVPSQLAPGESKLVSLTIQPNPSLEGQEYDALIRIRWNDETLESVPLRIQFETAPSPAPSNPLVAPSNAVSGLVSFASAQNNWWLDILLGLIVLVLLIAVVSRVRNRFWKKRRF